MKVRICNCLLVLLLVCSNVFALDIFESINSAKNIKNIESNNRFDNDDIYNEFTKNFIIEFIYSSQCGFCHKLSYILNDLQKNYKVIVTSITVDGGAINGFEDAIYSEEFIKENNIKAFPTLIARDKDNQRYLLAEGYISENELRSNIQVLLDYVKGGRNE